MDVIEGRGPHPRLVLLDIQRLPDTSMTVALSQGGVDHFGWGTDRWLLKLQHDLLQSLIRVSGTWKKGKEPKFEPFPSPASKPVETAKPKKKRSVADIFSIFQRG